MKTKPSQKNIPNGWQETKLASLGSFSKGSGITKEQLTDTGHNAIRYGELYTKFNFKIDRIYSHIPSEVLPKTTKIKYGDILFAGSGETNDEIGKSAAYLLKEDAYAGGDTIIFSPKKADSLFLSYFLNIGEGRKKLRELGQGQSVVHIYKSEIEKLKLHLPPLPEQNRIVSVLETWDQAIQKLSQKIEKKKNIKKGLMQELLTGKTRLAGFTEKWEANKLGHFLSLHDIKTKIDKEAPVLTSSRRGLMPQGEYYDERITTRDNSGFNLMPKGYITYRSRSDDGNYRFNINNLGYSGIVSKYYPVFTIKNGDNRFFLDFLNYNNHVYLGYSIGTSQLVLSFNELCKIKLKTPGKEEQVVIADILTTADKEIKILEHKLKTIQEQKRYLLNNLITGTIRTPETLSIKK